MQLPLHKVLLTASWYPVGNVYGHIRAKTLVHTSTGVSKSPGYCSECAEMARGPGSLTDDRRSSMLPNIFGDLDIYTGI